MKELIKIEQHNEIITVNARDLYVYLDAGDRFDQWIRRRIEKYGFILNQDFCTKMCRTSGRPYTEYFISIDMAKEHGNGRNTEKGREIRRYFIEVEKRARELDTQKLPQTFAEALRLAADQAEQIEQLKPKAERNDLIASSSGLILPREAGKVITGHPNTFCKDLVSRGILYRSRGKLIPKAEYQSRGYFEVKESYNEIADKSYVQTYFTPKGVE